MSDYTRRELAGATLGLALSAEIVEAWQHAHQAAGSATPPRLEHLEPNAAKEIEAITAQIIPSDGTPGAREAGVIYFIDRALGTFDSDKREAYRQGMEELQQSRRKMFPQSTTIAALQDAQVQQLIRAIENSDFFNLLRTHTVLGFLGDPSYGGNRGKVGWNHIGLEDKMAFEPPFGYYDAEAMKGGGE